MSVIRKFLPYSKLSTEIFRGERQSVLHLIERANQQLQALRPRYEAELNSIIEEIVERWGQGEDRDALPFAPLYKLACKILDLTSVTPGTGVEAAAFSLCNLVDWCARHNKWDWPRIDLHINAIRLLQLDGATMTEFERAQIGEGLLRLMAGVRAEPPRLNSLLA